VPIHVSRSSAIAGTSLLLAVLVLVGHRLAQTGAASAPEVVAPLEPVRSERSTARVVVVHVVGAVRRPGLYRLREGARAADAVARAGGVVRGANLAGLNLAAPLVDGTQVVVPRAPEADGPAAEGAAPAPGALGGGTVPGTPAAKVSLSSATAEELDALPGVGPVTAQKIVDYRAAHGPFASVDGLDAVPGIGPARIEQLRDLVTP
jgi:competence protein ComEA